MNPQHLAAAASAIGRCQIRAAQIKAIWAAEDAINAAVDDGRCDCLIKFEPGTKDYLIEYLSAFGFRVGQYTHDAAWIFWGAYTLTTLEETL